MYIKGEKDEKQIMMPEFQALGKVCMEHVGETFDQSPMQRLHWFTNEVWLFSSHSPRLGILRID